MGRAAAEANLEYVADAFERWNAGGREIEFEQDRPGGRTSHPARLDPGRPYRGHEGFRQWISDIDEQFERWQLHVEEWRILDDGVILGLGRDPGPGPREPYRNQPATGLAIHFSRTDRLFRYEVVYDPDEALRSRGSSSA